MMTLLILAACSPSEPAGTASWRETMPAPGPDPALAAAGISPTASADLAAGIDTVILLPPKDVVRFVALGDAGQGNDDQYKVGDAMATVCAARGCDFAVYLGDNFYNDGVNDLDDPQFEEKFELPYANLSFPFYVTLGNHDYGAGGSGYEFWKAPYYIEYTDRSAKWVFPAPFFRVDAGAVELFSLDTNAIVWGFFDDQLAWLEDRVPASTAAWTVAFGHHPYLSNGHHGNAGHYDGQDNNGIGDGEYVKEVMDQALCGKVDVYLCGHDHSRQWHENTCNGTELIVSGAGATTTGLDDTNPVRFQEDTLGFLWVELDATHFTGVFYNEDALAEFEHTLQR